MTSLPKHKDIAYRQMFSFELNLKEIIEKEETNFDNLIANNNMNGLISRYPIRETPVLTSIAAAFGLTRDKYESAVRKLIIDDANAKKYLKLQLQKLTELIEGKDSPVVTPIPLPSQVLSPATVL